MLKYLKIIFLFLILLVIVYNIKLDSFIKYKSKNKDVTISQTTVISTYFKINRSKHCDSYYQKWIQNFLLSVKSPLILFTDNKSISKQLLDLRKNLTTKLYIYSSHWAILKEIEQI